MSTTMSVKGGDKPPRLSVLPPLGRLSRQPSTEVSAREKVIPTLVFQSDDECVDLGVESKDAPVLPPVPVAHPRALHLALKSGKAAKPIQAWLSYYLQTNGAVNTPFTLAYPLQPNRDTSWASWQAVFDEVKVLSAEIHWHGRWFVLPTVMSANTPNAVIAYEPAGSQAMTSVNAGLQYEKFQLLDLGSSAPGLYPTLPEARSKSGFQVFRANVPGGAQSSSVGTALSSGVWRPTSDATDYYWGSFDGYVAAGGATSQISIEAFVRMRVEFRTRR